MESELELPLELEADEEPPEWRDPESELDELPPVRGTARSSPWPKDVAAATRTSGTIPMSLSVFMGLRTSRKVTLERECAEPGCCKRCARPTGVAEAAFAPRR